MSKYRKVTAISIFLFITIYFFSFGKDYQEVAIEFSFQSDTLKGVLVLPKEQNKQHAKTPLVIFVHGDGELDRTAYGYYQPIWNELAKNGIACMSWDKKGVGESTGNWLNQSMKDRALETIAAIQYAESALGFEGAAIGLIGFSQGGWVMPKVSSLSSYPDFMINISPAINWKRQSNYLTKKRLEKDGADAKTIELEINRNEASFQLFDPTLSYSDYVILQDSICLAHHRKTCQKIEENRYEFIQKNIENDAVTDIQNITCPTLVMFGSDDLNVDYLESYDTYKRILSQNKHPTYQVNIFENATHGLLKSKHFNYANPGLIFLIKFRLFKKRAFAEGFLQSVSDFILKNTVSY